MNHHRLSIILLTLSLLCLAVGIVMLMPNPTQSDLNKAYTAILLHVVLMLASAEIDDNDQTPLT